MMLVNWVLSAITLVVILANWVAVGALLSNVSNQIYNIRQETGESFGHVLVHRDSIRIAVGFMIICTCVGFIFLGRMPIRAMVAARELETAEQWLGYSLWWEFPSMLGILVGLGFIMWTAKRR